MAARLLLFAFPPTTTVSVLEKEQNKQSSKHDLLEGFKQNGHEIRIQREKLRISTSAKMFILF